MYDTPQTETKEEPKVDATGLTEPEKTVAMSQISTQLTTSRTFKRPRFGDITGNENLYYNIVTLSIRNPYNECFPYMAGFIDHMKAKIDDDSGLLYTHQAENDLKRAEKVNAFYEQESNSIDPSASWDLKHRHAKFNALFSGVAIYKYYAEQVPSYRSCLEVLSHYDFHCEPRGGAMLENHLFCGQDNIFRTQEELESGKQYNQEQVKKLVASYASNQYKDNADYDYIRNNRLRANKQDPETNNYVGQPVIKLVEWYTTFKGKRYYVLFNESTNIWIRFCLLTNLFPSNLWPYVSWHTNEDPDMFWSKAPADDARAVSKIMNTFINQELYNRQKQNYGETHYDVEMYPNVQSLVDSRPDKHVPVDTKGGTRSLSSGIYRPQVASLNGTLDLVTWLEQFTGKQVGYTASSAGESESNKKVGIYKGEIEQIDQLINVKNKSFRYALSAIGLRFKQGLDHNLTKPVAVKLMGAKGIEWTELSPEDLKTDKDLTIQPIGGSSEQALQRAKDQEKIAGLQDPSLTSVNPQWKDKQKLLLLGFDEEDTKEAFSADTFATKELLSEAAQAEKDIVQGKMPELNRGADSNFMQHIVDFATDTDDLSIETYTKLMEYAMAHVDIAVENEARNIKEIIRQKKIQMATQATPGAPGEPMPGAVPSPIQSNPQVGATPSLPAGV